MDPSTNNTFALDINGAGEVTITNEDGETFEMQPGDYVVFPKGMKCTWRINKDVRKHYNFG